tara:strand:- start:59 stop:475 length:417 start_codon:yes stop_codon:yes gene_type:complete
MEKYLYFCKGGTDKAFNAAHDVAVYPVSSFRGFTNQSTTETHLAMCFKPIEGEVGDDAGGGDDVNDVVTLTITANKHKEVINAVLAAIDAPKVAGTGKSMIVVADIMLQEFLPVGPDSSGTAVAISDLSITVQAGAAA